MVVWFFLTIRTPPKSTLSVTLFPTTARFLSGKACPRQGNHRRNGEAAQRGHPRAEQRLIPGEADTGVIEPGGLPRQQRLDRGRSEEHTSELQSLMRISYAVFCLKKKKSNYKVVITKLIDNTIST